MIFTKAGRRFFVMFSYRFGEYMAFPMSDDLYDAFFNRSSR